MAKEGESGERTEEATPRRREEAREKGQVALSSELVSAISLSAGLGVFLVFGGAIVETLGALLRSSLGDLAALGGRELSPGSAANLIQGAGEEGGRALLLLAGPLLIVTALVGFGQVGFHIAPKAVSPDLGKLNPVKGLERMFSMKSVVRLLMATAKLAVIGTTIVLTVSGKAAAISAMDATDIGPVLVAVGAIVLRAVVGGLIAIAVIGLIDLVYQRWQHEEELRMTKQEVKEEYKNMDGDPHIKARIRQIQREMASRRMMADVPEATVVVTNPTHYAVALKYDRDQAAGRAPVVVAKGVDHVAQEIKRVAAEHGVMQFEDVPLARALHAKCEIGDEVPEDLFEAVASVLAYVYRMQGAAAPLRA
ncbi:MAG: flagellar biosynthesis protein FlhB [Planctomycetes bacterium]|nr:flagellar biosynthesis protein FlhB [Planctomycetota bacterium]